MDFRLLNPNAAAEGVTQANAWADAAAERRAGRALADNDQVGAQDILNRNGMLGKAMNVQQNVWAEQNRQIAANERATVEEDRQRKIALDAEKLEADALGAMSTNLQAVLQNQGAEAVLPAFEMQARSWLSNGASPDSIEQMRAALAANPEQFLEAAAGAAAAANRRYQLYQQNGSVGSFDTRTGAVNEQIRMPQYRNVPAGTDLVEINGGGSGPAAAPTGGGATSAPASGEAVLPTMVAITARRESGDRERDASGNLITSSAGAQGRMQVMPTTNTDPGYGVTPARDDSDEERTRVGRDYLAAMMAEYGNDPQKAWAAYNWGPGNLDRALARGGDWLASAPRETRDYVASNMAALQGSAPSPTGGSLPGARVIASRPANPRAPTAAWRTMSPQEVEQQGLRAGGSYQINEANGQTRVAQQPPAAGRAGANGAPRLSPQDNVFLSKIRTDANQLQGMGNIYAQMEPLARNVDSGGFMAMPGAGTVLGAVNPEVRRFMALTDQLTPAMRNGLPGAASDRDVSMFRSATPSIDKPREANLAAIAAGRAWAQRQGDYAAFMEQYARSRGSLLGAQELWTQYANDQPLYSEGTHGMPRVNTVQPWRQYFSARQRTANPALSPTGGSPPRRRFNPATGRIE